MREIFFEEKLGETRRNSEGCEPHGQRWGASGGVRAVGCEPHGQGWERWEGWGIFGGETWRFWREGMVGAVRIIE